jgi:hypothetical protein
LDAGSAEVAEQATPQQQPLDAIIGAAQEVRPQPDVIDQHVIVLLKGEDPGLSVLALALHLFSRPLLGVNRTGISTAVSSKPICVAV